MKNFKINEGLKKRILSGGLCLTMLLTGCGKGQADKDNKPSKPNNTADYSCNCDEMVKEYLEEYISTVTVDEEIIKGYLEEYISERSKLEEEINDLSEQKTQLQNNQTFDINRLIVIEHTNTNNESNLYILSGDGTFYREYHGAFKAWYDVHSGSKKHTDYCSEYVHLYDYQKLLDYLTDEEMEKLTTNHGKITTFELDEILERIRAEYKAQQENDHSKVNSIK